MVESNKVDEAQSGKSESEDEYLKQRMSKAKYKIAVISALGLFMIGK